MGMGIIRDAVFAAGRVFPVHFPRYMIKFETELKIIKIGGGSFAEEVGCRRDDAFADGRERRSLHGDDCDQGRV